MAPTLRSRSVTYRPLQRTTTAVAAASSASTESGGAGVRGPRGRRRRRRQLEGDDDDDPDNSDPLAVGADSSSTYDKKKTARKKESKTVPESNEVSEPRTSTQTDPRLLFSLTEDAKGDSSSSQLVLGTLVCRPSTRNKSPYVADVYVPSLDRQAICHVPNLDMGGKCRPGVTVLMRHALDSKGQVVGPDAVSPKYGTPKCEFIVQLLWVDESNVASESPMNSSDLYYPPVWVGAHPSLGERIAKAWIDRNLLQLTTSSADGSESSITRVQSQVTIPEVPNRRFDFMVTYADGTQRIVEVKTVVDCDYSATAPPPTDLIKCRYFCNEPAGDNYRRTAIFPWGTRKQKGGTDGKTLVVSARAIHHVDELRRLVQLNKNYRATILFVIVRGDAVAFRPNHEACPEFVKSLRRAHQAGVGVVAKRVHFGTRSVGTVPSLSTDSDPSYASIRHPENCYSDIDLPIQWPDDDDDDAGEGSTSMP